MSDIELTYFPIHGRAFVPRMLFKLGGIDFKDTMVDQETFGKMKPGKFKLILRCYDI